MVSEKVKALLALNGKRQNDLDTYFGMTAQSMHNNIYRDSWSAKDMVAAAQFLGCKLAFVLPDGQLLTIEADESPDA